MCPSEKSKSIMGSPRGPSGNGPTKEKSIAYELPEDIDCSNSQSQRKRKRYQEQPLEETSSSTSECLPTNKKMTSSVRERICLPSDQEAESSKTSPVESTGNDQECSPFWTAQSTELSKKSWLPVAIGCRDSVSISWNGCCVDMVARLQSCSPLTSHQKKSCPTTCYPSCKCSAVEETEKEDTLSSTKIIKLRNVKLNPTKEQKLLLRRFEAAARYTYNATVGAVNGGDKLNKMSLRNKFVTTKENPWITDKEWLTETPKAIRQQAVFEVVKNFKAAFTNKTNGNIEKFKMTYKKKGRHNAQRPWTIGIEKAVKTNDQGDLVIFPETIGAIRYYGKLPFDEKPEAECGIHRNAKGDYFLRVPVKVQVKKQRPPEKIIALDPGVRKFVTGYSPTEEHGFYAGKQTDKKILEIQKSIDLVNSELTSAFVDCVRRRRLRKKKMKLYADYKNVRDDFHWKLANMLAIQYDRVLLPHLETAKLSRGLKAKVSRAMLSQSHGLFSQRLAEKCKERGVTFEEPSERHTSKTCGCCGMLTNVGSSETFACCCGYVADRDLNAARNIYIRTETYAES